MKLGISQKKAARAKNATDEKMRRCATKENWEKHKYFDDTRNGNSTMDWKCSSLYYIRKGWVYEWVNMNMNEYKKRLSIWMAFDVGNSK